MAEPIADLKKTILAEMVVDEGGALERNFLDAKQLLSLTKDGKVKLHNRELLTPSEQVLLYLIGKIYAKTAALTTSEWVGNAEILEELGLPRGTLDPALKDLRDGNRIKQKREGKLVSHSLPVHSVGRVLETLMAKKNGSGRK